MKNCLDKFTELTQGLFPEQLKVYDVCFLDKNKNSDMLHQHFFEPLSEAKQQELANQIAGYLRKQDKEKVYSFFWGNSKTDDFEAKWYVSSAMLNKSAEGNLQKIVIFTYDLQLLGEYKVKIYQVIENLNFLKKNYTKASLLTKREIEIIGLMAVGKTSFAIGEQLYISEHTVNTHRKNIYKKLELNTLSELMKYAAFFDLTTN